MVLRVIQTHRLQQLLPLQYQCKNAVIGTDEERFRGAQGDRLTRCTHTGVYHRHMYRTFREVIHRNVQQERAGGDVLRRHLMGEVYHPRIGAERSDDPFHHARVSVLRAEIG
ncbi:hypothetical protein HRbin16_02231 [bacterium HR16]|nr:hypothetical protein HRbin16_02231 [bacterium HR16]